MEAASPNSQVCLDLLLALEQHHEKEMNHTALIATKSSLSRSIRSIQRLQRKDKGDEWDNVLNIAKRLLRDWKEGNAPVDPTLPTSVTEYHTRLKAQKKEIYKKPPVLPPDHVTVEPIKCSVPKRDKNTGFLTFEANDPDVTPLLKDFKPNRTPEEVLRAGSFGGTYFRPITSAVTNISYKSEEVLKSTVEEEWIKDLPNEMLISSTYHSHVNKYGVKCGGSLGMWESSGWITDSDPYGWFQWYCRFYQGRRSSDDGRQISRWLKCAGPKGRFRSQLCNKILAAGRNHDDNTISPVIRQTLLHWGLEITPAVLDAHRRRTL